MYVLRTINSLSTSFWIVPPHIGSDAGLAVHEVQALDILGSVSRLDLNALGGEPRLAGRGLGRRRRILGLERQGSEVGKVAHLSQVLEEDRRQCRAMAV